MDIENYKELLKAIFNSDNKETKTNSVICVYDILDFDKLVAVFSNSKLCAEFFGTTRETIDCNVCRKEIKSKRYRLERVIL